MSRASVVRLSCIVITTPRSWRFGFGRDLIFSIVSSKSSVPSSAKYDDWIGTSTGVDGDHAQGRRRVDEDVVVLGGDVRHPVFEPERTVEVTDQLRLQLRQGDA